MNRTHTRRQIDVNKALIKVESADEFFNKENEEGESVLGNEKIGGSELKKKSTSTSDIPLPDAGIAIPAPKKQEIIIPVIKQTEDPTKALPDFDEVMYKKRKAQSHYIRINYVQPQPNPNMYEPTDKDLQFLKEVNEKVPKSSKSNNEISIPNFSKTIELWELATDKNDMIALTKAQSTVETLYPAPVKDVVPKIYEYWKNLRETYQRPLLRKYWRVVNKDENNPNAAFRARENPKMKTRRAQRTNEAENLEKMKLFHQDLEMVTVLLGNVRYREMLKMEMFDLTVMKFESSLREKADHSSNTKLVERFKESYENDTYLKLRNKMKDYNKDADKIIKDLNKPAPEPKPIEEPPVPIKPIPKPGPIPTGNTTEELNFDLGSFIATIIEESLNKDITPQKIKDLDPEPGQGQGIKINGPDAPLNEPEYIRRGSFKNPPTHEPIPPVLTPTNVPELTRNRTLPPAPGTKNRIIQPPQLEEKSSILRYMVRRRIGRSKRMLLEKVFDEDDHHSHLFVHPKDYYAMNNAQNREIVITPEIEQKLPNANLRQLYLTRFEKFRDICPFNDSEEETDMTESNKMIKNLATNFKNFMKQRRPVNPIM